MEFLCPLKLLLVYTKLNPIAWSRVRHCMRLSPLVPLGDPCYTPDPNVVRIEEKIYKL